MNGADRPTLPTSGSGDQEERGRARVDVRDPDARRGDRHRARIIVEGHGCRLTDSDGQSYIDGLAGLWLVNAGYGRKEIADAVAPQMPRPTT